MLELEQGTELVDRYALLRRLGGDGVTQTWLATDRFTRASVALKIADASAQSSAALRAEWQVNIRLMHAHIVRAFEFHKDSERAFFSQQYVDGPDFSVLSGLPVADVLGPVGMLLDALTYVHSKGVVHRDIKAANVLLDSNGSAYLSDFGASCAVGQLASGGSLIAQNPQSLDGQAASCADDIFALGSMIFELLAGRPPWRCGEIAADIRHRTENLQHGKDGSPLPQSVTDLLAKMLDKDASKRPSADAVARELETAGFTPHTAINRGGSAPRLEDEVVESIASVHPSPRPHGEGGKGLDKQATGLNKVGVAISLLALVMLLIGVVFVLPDTLSERTVSSSGDPFSEIQSANTASSLVRDKVIVDPEIRRRAGGARPAPARKLADDQDITFSENRADYSGLNDQGHARFNAESTLGELLSALEILEARGVERWAGQEYRAAYDLYQKGDQVYLEKDFAYSQELYLGALTVLEPLYVRIEPSFKAAYEAGMVAFDAGERLEALRLFELAVAITPSHAGALAGYQRAKNLYAVLQLVDQGIEHEHNLDLTAAAKSFQQAAALDNLWQPAQEGISRVARSRTELEFDTRMTEGFKALAAADFLGARAAFRVAGQLVPESTEPADGLLQVDQGLRLQEIGTLEREAKSLERDEHWDAVVQTYEEILKVDGSLSFAGDGLAHGRQMSALHARLDAMIAEPDRLSVPAVMQSATRLVVDITTRANVGFRLAGQRDELSRLLKRAVTELSVPLISDNVTRVFVYKVGALGTFMRKQISLRPGTYIVVGSRPGFRDVRLEFRVAPEIDMQPVVVQCEEAI